MNEEEIRPLAPGRGGGGQGRPVTLYGVGVGPGAPDLLTLRAARVLREAPVLAVPRANDHARSMAWQIAAPVVGDNPHQERLALTFPMSKDPARLRAALEEACARIGDRLERGLSVAFLTEGDPSLYSTFIYLEREARRRWPGVAVEVIPGVSSLAAVPAVAGVRLADGRERIAIVPASHGVEDLPALLTSFDTVVLMKIGDRMPAVITALERTGLIGRAVYVSRATMPDQRIERDLSRVCGREHGDCFAMVVVARKESSGVLLGQAAAAAAGGGP